MKKIIYKLKKINKTISTMESCTGGLLVNEITNVEGASEIIKFSAVTYSNKFKIRMGVDKNIIDKYGVYSKQVACEMSKKICLFTNSNYGIGITGKLNKYDKKNPNGLDNEVFVSVYNNDTNETYEFNILIKKSTRKANKQQVVNETIKYLEEIII